MEEGCEDVPENSTCVGSVGGTIVQITCLPGTTGDQCDQGKIHIVYLALCLISFLICFISRLNHCYWERKYT